MQFPKTNSDYCWCSEEQMLKPCHMFYKMKGSDEHQPICKSCVGKKSKKIRLAGESLISKILLSKLGYNPDSEETIYQQFKKKHQL